MLSGEEKSKMNRLLSSVRNARKPFLDERYEKNRKKGGEKLPVNTQT